MSSYRQTPSGGQVTSFSHVGGALATPAFVPGSQYPSNAAPYGVKEDSPSSVSGREIGTKIFPYTVNGGIIGLPLFAKAHSSQQNYTPNP
jgi:hypothetical protein